MKICFIAHNFVRGDGQGRINYETALYTARRGHEVTLLADRVSPELADEKNISWEQIKKVPNRPNLLAVRMFASAANRCVRRLEDQFDVVVGAGFTLSEKHDVNLCQFVHEAWRKSPVHVAKLSHGPWAWYQWLYSRCNARWERLSYAASRIVVAPSAKIKAELISIGVPAERIVIIYNGVEPTEFQPALSRESKIAIRQGLGLPVSKPVALFVGDIRTTRKNLDSVLKATREIPRLHLAVVGATDRSPFPAMAQNLGIADRVTFEGFRRDVNKFMQASDLFVFPSRYEAGTLVLIEAAASGLPLVTAASAGGAEAFGSDVAEIINDPDDLPALVNAIKRFSESPAERDRAALAARAAGERLTWTEMAKKYLELFETCAEKKRRTSPQQRTVRLRTESVV